MGRWTLVLVVSLVLLGVGSVASSPVKGQRRRQEDDRKERARVMPGAEYFFREAFYGNQRACVIVEGDHKPVTNIKIVVRDAKDRIVARDDGPGDFGCAIWYPPSTQDYKITITSDGKEYNDLDVVVK